MAALQNRSAQNNSVQNRSAQNHSVQNRSAQNRSVQNRSAQNRAVLRRTDGSAQNRLFCAEPLRMVLVTFGFYFGFSYHMVCKAWLGDTLYQI